MKPFTRETLADYLSCSVDHVDDLRKQGKIRATQIGKREGIRFTQQDVEEFLKQCALSNTENIGRSGSKTGAGSPYVRPTLEKRNNA